MFAPVKRLAALSLAVSGILIVGCDDKTAGDKKVIKKLNDAATSLAKSDDFDPNNNAREAAHKALTEAAGEKSASGVWQAIASSQVGDLDLQSAATARVHLIDTELQIRGVINDLRSLSQQIAMTNALATAQQQTDPKDALAKLSTQVAEIQGDAQKATWSPAPKAMLPTLAAIKGDITRLEAEVAQRKQQIADLTKQRSDALTQAEAKFTEAEKQKGDAAVKTYVEGTESRRQAEDFGTNIMLVQDQLGRSESDLALAKAQEASLTKGIESLQSQDAELKKGWVATSAFIDQQRAEAKALLEGNDKATASIKAKTDELNTLRTKAEGERKVIDDLLKEADKFYGSAADQSKAFSTWVSTTYKDDPKASQTWAAVGESVHMGRFQVQRGIIQRERGTIDMANAALLRDIATAVASVQVALSGAKLESQASLPAIEPNTVNALAKSASDSFKESKDTLMSVTEGNASPSIKNASLVNRLITMQAALHLQSLKLTPGEPTESDAVSMAEANKLKQEILDAKLRLPRLPGELGETPPPQPAPAPGTEGGTPAPEGTTPAAPAPAPAAPEGAAPAPAAPAAPAPEAPAAPAAPDAPPAAPAEGPAAPAAPGM
jgi:hypothetical protein